MEKRIVHGEHVGYTIGMHISIHRHIRSGKYWYLTCQLLDIHGVQLCEKTCTEDEIRQAAISKFEGIRSKAMKMISQIKKDK